jgi:ferritin-like protein
VKHGIKADALDKLLTNGIHRRAFAKRVFAGSLAAAGAIAVSDVDVVAQAVTDGDILNFALNLEYLEAEFYTVAATGKRIEELGIGVSGRGRAGATVGGSKVSLDDRVGAITQQIAQDEQNHVTYLRTALRSAAVAKPDINLAALGVGFSNQAEFLTVAAIFEDVGVSAYGGAAPLIDNSRILAVAARIALTEAQHAGVLRLLASDGKLAVPQVDTTSVPPLGQPNGRLFFVDGAGLSPVRTTSEVLRIVYAGGRNEGGFFPNGFNGTIETA